MIAVVLLSALYGVGGFGGYALPNPHVTPGGTVDITKKQVCETKWGRDRRFVTQHMKEQVCARYGAKNCPGPRWELDHLIPRELGGKDSTENLWPQPIAEARLKDRLENWAHRAVCSGALALHEAQELLRHDWTDGYARMKGL